MKTDIWRWQTRDRDGKTSDRGERRRRRRRDRKQEGVGEGGREIWQCDFFLKSAFFIVYLSFGTSDALHPANQTSVNAMNPPEQSYCRSRTLQRLLSLLVCRYPTESHLISLTQLPTNTLLVATSSSIKFKRML